MSGITYQSFERDFRIEKRLGKGNYAVVNQVLHLLDHHSYAHKCIEFASFDELSIAFNEVETIKCIDDERIVKVTRPPRSSSTTTRARTSAPASSSSASSWSSATRPSQN